MLFWYRRCNGSNPDPPLHPPTPLSFHLVERRVPDRNAVDLCQDIPSPCLAQALSLSSGAIGKALESRHTTPDRSSVRSPHRLCHAKQAKDGNAFRGIQGATSYKRSTLEQCDVALWRCAGTCFWTASLRNDAGAGLMMTE